MKHLFSPILQRGSFFLGLVILSLQGLVAQAQGPAVACTGQDAGGQAATNGLYAEYYAGYFNDDQSFFAAHTPGLTRVDPLLNFTSTASWGSISPPATSAPGASPGAKDNFSVRIRGSLMVQKAGTYTLYLTSDDASFLWLDNAVLATPTEAAAAIKNGGSHGPTEKTATIYLTKGLHNILVHYGDIAGSNILKLEWYSTDAGISREIIPTASLCTSLQPLRSYPQSLVYTPNYTATATGTKVTSEPPTVTSSSRISEYILINASSLPAGITINKTTGVLTADKDVPVGTYVADVAATNDDGSTTFTQVFTFIITPPPPAGVTGTDPGGHPAAQGLYIEYYPGNFNTTTDFNAFFAQAPARSWVIPQVDLTNNWGIINPPATGSLRNPNNFSARLRGTLSVPVTGNYVFYLTSDDGAILWLDNDAISSPLLLNKAAINDGGSHAPVTKQVRRFLTAGLHNVLVLYGEGEGSNILQLEWSSTAAGITRQIIPSTAFGTPLQRFWQLPEALTYAPITTTVGVSGSGSSAVPTVSSPRPVSGFALTNAEDLPAGITIDAATGRLLTDGTVPEGRYQVDVAVINTEGSTTFPRTFAFVIAPPPPPGCTGTDPGNKPVTAGLYGEYYAGYFDDLDNNQNFFTAQTPSMLRTELGLNFDQDDWGTLVGPELDSKGLPNMFSARFRGRLYVPVAGQYTFALTSDDASYLWLDGAALATPPTTESALINNGTGHPPITITGTVTLSAGLHPILVHYGEFTASNRLILSWKSTAAGIPDLVPIPATLLCTGIGAAPLPVELVRFQARAASGGTVQLDWETALEKNSAYFAVERSTDGQHFTEIGRQAGAGNSSHAQRYQFVDRRPGAGLNYYRLRQTDWDGAVQYSPVQTVQLASRQELLLNVFPNPSTGKFVVRVSQPAAAEASLEILDLQGRRLYTQALPAQSTGEYRINAPGLARGAYLVRLITQGGSTTQKLLIE
ncbi:PA14 domain-containing protein [Hymenobacter sp. DG25A]|uniref:PA14 domain-containing protein n=1 Tax=Hymenobacter sp. DG25A TaxID=1385663 RepID=UPI0006C88878|nr:PA14 domain-containing protein [Hymenobacter sp. DG25A]